MSLGSDFDAGPLGQDRSFQEALRRLPMFPLPNVVLFPHALLPLHIFEERYREMARDILAGQRFLAMALIAPGQDLDVMEKPSVRPVAGIGEVVMAHELADGRFNLVVRGRARIHIDDELISDRPYRLITASTLPDLPLGDPGELRDADQSLRALVGHLADAIPEGGELLRQVVASQETSSELVDVLAAALVVDGTQRQSLLETRDVLRRIERVSAEVVAMTARISSSSVVN
jgi:Lon protease-like protein